MDSNANIPTYATYFKPSQANLVRKNKSPWIAASSDPDKDPEKIEVFNKQMQALSLTKKATADDLVEPKTID